jgi:hypothetical protein
VAGKRGGRAAWGQARHSFRVLSREIMAELKTSASKKEVYERFKDRLGMSYATFAAWAKVYEEKSDAPLLAPLKASDKAPLDPEIADAPRSAQPAVPRKQSSGPLIVRSEKERTFHWDPTEAFNKKFD